VRSQKLNIFGLAVALLAPLVVAAIGGWVTASSVATWYPGLKKPTWNPPTWVFGPVWTLLYLLMGLASWLIWRERTVQPERARRALGWYGLQLGLNLLWSLLFFGLRRIDLALAEIMALWAALTITLLKFGRIRRDSAAMLAPYLLWTTFAAILNAAIWRLNRNNSSRSSG
jgi:tryptophan-rich sensory protein